MNSGISAVEHLRALRGGARSHLLRASDGHCYVVKFQNNPQHIRVLANEMFATRLGLAMGLPMPRAEIVDVSAWLIEQTEDLGIVLSGGRIPCQSGWQLGSLYIGGPDSTLDYLPAQLMRNVRNVADFARVLVLDKWTSNVDGRQAIFWRQTAGTQGYNATFIDQGYCFNAGEWNFVDFPLRGVYAHNAVYDGVRGWDAFEPALTRAEEMSEAAIWQCAAAIPEEWYEYDRTGLDRLVESLCRRRRLIRQLIHEFRKSPRNPFPSWRNRVFSPNLAADHSSALSLLKR